MTQMFSRREFHFPLIAAQFQYRERYYGLASAAMLEDLFFDALTHYVSTFEPNSILSRPPRGEKGYDYEFNKLRISHKVSKAGPIEIAALWDATRTGVKNWTFETPISFTNSNYSSKKIRVQPVQTEGYVSVSKESKSFDIRAAAATDLVKEGEIVVLASWPSGALFNIEEIWTIPTDGLLREQLPFTEVWRSVARLERASVPANEIEMMVFPKTAANLIQNGMSIAVTEEVFRPGIYFFSLDQLVGVPIKANNRAQLVPRKFIAGLMTESVQRLQFVPTSNWFMTYAGANPPDLYIAQKQDFDLYFSNQDLAFRSANRSNR
jgi:hypothetical protein